MFLHSYTLSNISTYIRQMWLAWRQKANGWLKSVELFSFYDYGRNCASIVYTWWKVSVLEVEPNLSIRSNLEPIGGFLSGFLLPFDRRGLSQSWCVIYTRASNPRERHRQREKKRKTEREDPKRGLSCNRFIRDSINATIRFSLLSIIFFIS